MLQLGGGADLAQEPRRAQGGAELGLVHLDGHVAVVLEIVGEVHGGHAACAELADDGVPVAQGDGEALRLGHLVERRDGRRTGARAPSLDHGGNLARQRTRREAHPRRGAPDGKISPAPGDADYRLATGSPVSVNTRSRIAATCVAIGASAPFITLMYVR